MLHNLKLTNSRPLNKSAKPGLTIAILACFVGNPAIAQSEKSGGAKLIDGPELSGPIVSGKGHDDASNADPNTTRKPDEAYGAYQRGYYLTALELALPRADSGDPAAQTLIAEIYWKGLGVARDKKKAADWYRFAANGGNRTAQFLYANILLRGDGLKTDKKEGRKYMEMAAKAGHVRGQFNLAQLMTDERPTWAGYKRALPWYEKAAKAGLADAQYAMANIYADAKGVTTNDDVTARKWLAKAAQGGMDTAQLEYGVWLANGRGGEKNETEAFKWLRLAAAQRNIAAQNRIAHAYYAGMGVKPDQIKSAAWNILAKRGGRTDIILDQRFNRLSDIDKRRAIELANRISK